MRSNGELIEVRDELRTLNDQLETKVKDRTEELSAMHQQFWHASKLATVGEGSLRRVYHPGCHRYAFTLDRRRTLIALPALPYPKASPEAP